MNDGSTLYGLAVTVIIPLSASIPNPPDPSESSRAIPPDLDQKRSSFESESLHVCECAITGIAMRTKQIISVLREVFFEVIARFECRINTETPPKLQFPACKFTSYYCPAFKKHENPFSFGPQKLRKLRLSHSEKQHRRNIKFFYMRFLLLAYLKGTFSIKKGCRFFVFRLIDSPQRVEKTGISPECRNISISHTRFVFINFPTFPPLYATNFQ
jgi:hypothetical protein